MAGVLKLTPPAFRSSCARQGWVVSFGVVMPNYVSLPRRRCYTLQGCRQPRRDSSANDPSPPPHPRNKATRIINAKKARTCLKPAQDVPSDSLVLFSAPNVGRLQFSILLRLNRFCLERSGFTLGQSIIYDRVARGLQTCEHGGARSPGNRRACPAAVGFDSSRRVSSHTREYKHPKLNRLRGLDADRASS